MVELVIVVFLYRDKTTDTVSSVTGTGFSYQTTLDRIFAPPSEAKIRHGAQLDEGLWGLIEMVADVSEIFDEGGDASSELLPY